MFFCSLGCKLIFWCRFYNGGLRERDILSRAYMRLIKHINSIYKVRCSHVVL